MPSGETSENSRFTAPQVSTDQQLKDQTVGLVQLADFKKRTADALENDGIPRSASPSASSLAIKPAKKKAKKNKKGGLSFGDDTDDAGDDGSSVTDQSRSATPKRLQTESSDGAARKIGANAGVDFVVKSMTKSSLAREAQIKEQLRAEYLAVQARVKATEFIVPFVLSADGRDMPGGTARLRKGDQVWRFLDQAKRIGAEQSGKGLRQWARVNVDDLMLAKDFLILPQHFEFYWFMQNSARGYSEQFFPYSSDITAASPASVEVEQKAVGGLTIPGQKPVATIQQPPAPPAATLEGFDADPTATKVVLRPWYERNKHIYPMSTWKEFSSEVDYTKEVRKDADGNAFFAST